MAVSRCLKVSATIQGPAKELNANPQPLLCKQKTPGVASRLLEEEACVPYSLA